jgi:hypothetical protein
MRHPFDGIIVPESAALEPSPSQKTRRSILKMLAGAVAALFGLASRSQAQVQQKGALSLALGEAGGTALTQAFKEEAGDPTKDPTKVRGEAGGPVTDAVGEQGVTTKALNEEGGRVTTLALGEEGGKLTKALNEGGATTNAIGEEGATTNAIGEEGGRPPRLTEALNEDGKRVPMTQAKREDGGIATTFAVGEEGGQN